VQIAGEEGGPREEGKAKAKEEIGSVSPKAVSVSPEEERDPERKALKRNEKKSRNLSLLLSTRELRERTEEKKKN